MSHACDASPGQSYSKLTGKKTISYDGACHTVKDQAADNAGNPANPGSVLKTGLDSAGRIASVTETTATGTQQTTYAYDAMDNLTDVNRGIQHRMFRYDALGRLTSSSNPESGFTTYGYDNNGNLNKKTDARNVSVCFGPISGTQCNAAIGYGSGNYYDGLNRPFLKAYPDGTPAVTYGYSQDLSGGQTNYAMGRLTSVRAGATTVRFNRFDAAGRVLQHTQDTTGAAGSPYSFQYQYNNGGLPIQITYPSGRAISTTYDGAGRPGSLSGLLSGITTNYAGPPIGQSYIQYASHGAISQMYLGKLASGQWALNERRGYNSRFQTTSISLLNSTGSTIRGLTLGYGGGDNNGNLQSQTISGTGLAASATQTYQYHPLNQLKSADEGAAWSWHWMGPCGEPDLSRRSRFHLRRGEPDDHEVCNSGSEKSSPLANDWHLSRSAE